MSVSRCAHNDSLSGSQTAVPAVLCKVIRKKVTCRPGAVMRLPACGSWAALAWAGPRRQKRLPQELGRCLTSPSWCGGTFSRP